MHSKNTVAIGGAGFGPILGYLEIEKYIISLVSKKTIFSSYRHPPGSVACRN